MGAERSTDVPTLWAEIDRLNAEIARLKEQAAGASEMDALLLRADPPERKELIDEIARCAAALAECNDPEQIRTRESDLAYAKLALEVYDERYSR